jgi:hypothetical protein
MVVSGRSRHNTKSCHVSVRATWRSRLSSIKSSDFFLFVSGSQSGACYTCPTFHLLFLYHLRRRSFFPTPQSMISRWLILDHSRQPRHPLPLLTPRFHRAAAPAVSCRRKQIRGGSQRRVHSPRQGLGSHGPPPASMPSDQANHTSCRATPGPRACGALVAICESR